MATITLRIVRVSCVPISSINAKGFTMRSTMQVTAFSRRQFLRLALFGALGLVIAPDGECFALPNIKVLELKTISRDEKVYHAWPTLTRRKNGDLLVVFSGGREGHIDPFGRVDLIVSHDEGGTWSWPRTILDGDLDERDAGVIETRSGALLVTTFSSMTYASQLGAAKGQGLLDDVAKDRWMSAHSRLRADEAKSELGQWMIRSTDGGRTWSTRYATIVNSPHGPLQLADGRILYAGRELSGSRKRVGVVESTDDGSTWRWLADIPFANGHGYSNYHELHAVEASSGKIVVHIRYIKEGEPEEILQSDSKDGGRTWSVPVPIGVFGFPSHLSRLRDNRLLMTYGFRIKPTGVRVRLSGDEGKTWSDELVITSDGTSSDLGYPSTVQLDEKTFLTVWYERLKASRLAVLRQARWSIAN